METSPHEVTRLLQAWSAGEQGAFDKLVPVVYQELLVPVVYQELHRLAHTTWPKNGSIPTRAAIFLTAFKVPGDRSPAWRFQAYRLDVYYP